jgi:hypothetical protein
VQSEEYRASCKTPVKDGHDGAWPSRSRGNGLFRELEGRAPSRPRELCKRLYRLESADWSGAPP